MVEARSQLPVDDLTAPNEAAAIGLELLLVALGTIAMCGLCPLGFVLLGAGHGTNVFLGLHSLPLPPLGELWGMPLVSVAVLWATIGLLASLRRFWLLRFLGSALLLTHLGFLSWTVRENWYEISTVAQSLPDVLALWSAVYLIVCLPQVIALAAAWMKSRRPSDSTQ